MTPPVPDCRLLWRQGPQCPPSLQAVLYMFHSSPEDCWQTPHAWDSAIGVFSVPPWGHSFPSLVGFTRSGSLLLLCTPPSRKSMYNLALQSEMFVPSLQGNLGLPGGPRPHLTFSSDSTLPLLPVMFVPKPAPSRLVSTGVGRSVASPCGRGVHARAAASAGCSHPS